MTSLGQFSVEEDEATRVARLVDAEARALQLFDAVVDRGLIWPGATERQISDAVRDLAADLFGASRFWHKRIVRAGENTLLPYRENPPDRVLTDDDIAFLDFGPIFEEWEADFGRTYVLGDDPRKHALAGALERVWFGGRDVFCADPGITGEQLYARVRELAADSGWEFGAKIAGHLVGQFPHEKISGSDVHAYIAPDSDRPMRRLDDAGLACHWILEVHLVDHTAGFGGFYEQLLDIGPNA
jgi:Xaa-Pro aminopeptidase